MPVDGSLLKDKHILVVNDENDSIETIMDILKERFATSPNSLRLTNGNILRSIIEYWFRVSTLKSYFFYRLKYHSWLSSFNPFRTKM